LLARPVALMSTHLRTLAAFLVVALFSQSRAADVTASADWMSKLDSLLQKQVARVGRSQVVLRASSPSAVATATGMATALGARTIRDLPLVQGVALDVPNTVLPVLATSALVEHLSTDRIVAGAMERTGGTVGAPAVRQELGVDGGGTGIALIDSGVTPWHDDLGDGGGHQRVDRFVDFINGTQTVYDDYGHGTHVAGIIAGNGYDSSGARSGIAPGARLVVLKVLDGTGRGRTSDVIAAIDYAIAHKDELNIRVINLSVAAGVYESYNADPMTLAAQHAVSAGIVVVAAGGNYGRGPLGTTKYAGVTSPGNAPWVLTVGASSHMGTVDRSDDTMAAFSSRGPGAVDYGAKPDLVAPGVGIESLSNPDSWMYTVDGPYLLNGTVATSYLPYLSLSGTSMAAPVVTGTVALMLQANPSLTPNAVKAILEYTAQIYAGHDSLTQGAGFLNAKGAVELASYLAAPDSRSYPSTDGWSQLIIWGNHAASGGRFTPSANAWSTSVSWGDSLTRGGERISWGVQCGLLGCATVTSQKWQTSCLNLLCTVFDVDIGTYPNVVWGALCGGADCAIVWSPGAVTATSDPEADTVVWGSSDNEADTVVWGSSCTDPSCEPVVWGRR
jgi:serine protease AprX